VKRFLPAAVQKASANAGGDVRPAPGKFSGSPVRLVRQGVAVTRPRPLVLGMFQFRNVRHVPPVRAAAWSDESLAQQAPNEAGALLAQVGGRESTA